MDKRKEFLEYIANMSFVDMQEFTGYISCSMSDLMDIDASMEDVSEIPLRDIGAFLTVFANRELEILNNKKEE